jgi:hypothetical protein
MKFLDQLVPAVIILVANLMSGPHSSLRWERVTAVFGWTAAVSLVLLVASSALFGRTAATPYLLQIAAFSLLTALSRDYERILRPLFPWNR